MELDCGMCSMEGWRWSDGPPHPYLAINAEINPSVFRQYRTVPVGTGITGAVLDDSTVGEDMSAEDEYSLTDAVGSCTVTL